MDNVVALCYGFMYNWNVGGWQQPTYYQAVVICSHRPGRGECRSSIFAGRLVKKQNHCD